jgi:hypothetical protein
MNLLQSHKAIRHASMAVDDGGLLLIAAACPEGIGSESLEETFMLGRNEVPSRVRERYTLNAQAAMSIHEITGRIDVRVLSGLSADKLQRYGLGRWDPEETSGLLAGIPGEEILVITDAGSFLPLTG